MPGPLRPGKLRLMRADGDLIGRVAHARPRLDARTARRIDELGARLREDVEVALRLGVAADVLRAELDVEVDAVGDLLPLLQRELEDLGVHVHVGLLAAGARAAVGDVDLRAGQRSRSGTPLRGSPGVATIGSRVRQIDLERREVLRVRVRLHDPLAHVLGDEPALLHEVVDDDLVGLDDPGEAAGLDGHVREGRALVERHRPDAVAGELEHLADPLPRLEERLAEDVEHDVLRADAVREEAGEDEARRLRDGDADVLRVPGVRHVGRTDAEREAAERARHAGVRVGTGDELARERELLDHLVVADGLRADELAVAMNLSVELHALTLRERLLDGGELLGLLLQPHVAVRARHHEIEEREMIAEREDALGIGDHRVLAHLRGEERLRHRRHVLVAEADVRAGEERVAGLHRDRAELSGLRVDDDVRGEDLLAEGHRARGRRHRGRRRLAGEARAVVREEAAVLDDGRADRVEALRELARSGSLRRAGCARSARSRST